MHDSRKEVNLAKASTSTFNPASVSKQSVETRSSVLDDSLIGLNNIYLHDNQNQTSTLNSAPVSKQITVLSNIPMDIANNCTQDMHSVPPPVIHAEIIKNDGTPVPFVFDEDSNFTALYNKYCLGGPLESGVLLTGSTVQNLLQTVFAYPTLAQHYGKLRTDFDELRNKFNKHIFDDTLKQQNQAPARNLPPVSPPSELFREMKPISSEAELNEVEKKIVQPEYYELWVSIFVLNT